MRLMNLAWNTQNLAGNTQNLAWNTQNPILWPLKLRSLLNGMEDVSLHLWIKLQYNWYSQEVERCVVRPINFCFAITSRLYIMDREEARRMVDYV